VKKRICLFLIFCISFFLFSKPVKASVILLDSLCTDKASGYSMQTKIVCCEIDGVRKTHFAYCRIESNKKFIPWQTKSVWVATFDHQKNMIESRTFLGNIFDNHGTPCLTVDSEGYLHIVYGPHHHPFIYQKSKLPNNSTEWQEKEIISFEFGLINESNPYWKSKEFIEKKGKSEWTYPIIKIDREKNIHVAGSLGHSAAYVRKVKGVWQHPQLIYKAKRDLCRYSVMMNIDLNGKIYILVPDVDIETNSKKYYQFDAEYYLFRSQDAGETFSNLGLAISGHYQGSGNLATDGTGNVHFLCFERSFENHRWLCHLWFDGVEWHKKNLNLPERYIWSSSLNINRNGNIQILAAANRSDYHWRDASNEIYLFSGMLIGKNKYTFKNNKIVSKRAETNAWLPNLEENQLHTNFKEDSYFIMWTEETDLNGKYTSHKNSALTTKLYIKQIKNQSF
jgi:hypothetical protein